MSSSHPTSSGRSGERTSTASVTRTNGRIALAIFTVAVAARLTFLLGSPDRDWPHSIFYEGDAIVWVDWAMAIDQHDVYQFDLPIHPPAVAYTIAYVYSGVRDAGFLGLKLIWCVMSAAACAIIFLACASAMNRRIAVIASLLLAFSFNQYVLATSLNNETPYLLLLTIIVMLTQRAIRNPSRWTIVALGAANGLAMLLRAEHPLLLAMVLAWMLFARTPPPRLRFRERALCVARAAAIALLVCLPWTIHATLATKRFNSSQAQPIAFNLAPIEWTESAQQALNDLPAFARIDLFAVLNHQMQTRSKDTIDAPDLHEYLLNEFNWIPRPLPAFVLVSNQGPFSFALANHPQADGGFSRAALAHPMRGSDPTFAFAFPPHNRVFTNGWRVGWEYVISDGAAAAHNIRRKLARFANGVSGGFGAANLPLSREGVREPVDMFVSDSGAAKWWRPLLLTLITLGIIFALARRIPAGLWFLLIINKLIITMLFYGYARQGASIAPAFFVFIAIALDSMLIPPDRRLPRVMFWLPAATLIGCIAMLTADVALKRGPHIERIVGEHVDRPELGTNAFQAFNRIEIRAAP